MNNIIVFTQNLKLNFLKQFSNYINQNSSNVFITTHFLFDNEKEFISGCFSNSCFRDFASYLTDGEMSYCDEIAFSKEKNDHNICIELIKRAKNRIVIKKVLEEFPESEKYILCNDLGLDLKEWRENGFKPVIGDYYYTENKSIQKSIRHFVGRSITIKKIYHKLLKKKKNVIHLPDEVNVGFYKGRKYIFLGKMSRIGYRLDISFTGSIEECEKINRGEFETKDTCTYMTTWHEQQKCNVPDDERYSVRWAQDGYLPPNYSHNDYAFKPDNVIYYCWDKLGTQLFKNKNLPYEMIPFRKKLYMSEPVFPVKVKSILIVASGSGDWTALKNRSDDDIMVDAFVQMAKWFPNIHFTYRCHPTWIHPLNVGVNAINRVGDYFDWLNLPNLTLSSNTPIANEDGNFQLSFSRSSLEEDLANADFVFGEHSISMVDAAFKKIPFCSVNLTKRRNFFIGMNDLGFPTCSTHEEIAEMIGKISDKEFQSEYLEAVKNYNNMTDEDE